MNPPPQLIDDLRLLEAPVPFWTQTWFIGMASTLVCAGLIFLWIWWRRRHPRVENAETSNVPDTACEDALAELERLFSLIEAESSRPYAIESSGIIRRYIERRFEIRAPLRSTEEFLHEARHSPKLAREQQSLLGEFLRCCDFLKFGKGHATRDELESLHRSAVNFVVGTRPAAAQPQEVAAA